MSIRTGQRQVSHRCPKCGGNMFIYEDFQGWYEQCLQCSFIVYLEVVYENGKKTHKIVQNTAL